MYNRQYFEVGNNYKIIGNYCIHKYNKSDLFDDMDMTSIISKYDCNHIVAYIHENGKIERCNKISNNDIYYVFGNNMLRRIYNASKHDKRAYDLYDRIKDDDYNFYGIGKSYILHYNNNDLLK